MQGKYGLFRELVDKLIRCDHNDQKHVRNLNETTKQATNSKNITNIPSVIYYGIVKEKPCLIIPYYDCNLNQLILNNKLEDKHSLLIIKKILSVLEKY